MTIELNTLGTVIKTAYEAEPNTNAFTDAEKTKLANLNPSQFSGNYDDLANKPDLFSGKWDDLRERPAYIASGASKAAVVADMNVVTENRIGAANGVAPLDSAGLVPLVHLNVGGLSFHGAWNPLTNSPQLINGTGTVGHFYKASHEGTYNFGNGDFHFLVGDWVIYAGGTWQRIGVSETVTAVNGKIGNIVLTAADVGALPADHTAPVTSVNGKNGDVVLSAADVGAKPDSYAPAWADVSGKPTTATRWPTYAEVTGKPRNYVHRGTISPPIAAGRRLGGIKEIARDTETKYNSWSTSSGYDVYGTIGAERITPPSWAKYIRVTGTIVMQHMSLDSHVRASVAATSASNVLTNVVVANARGCGNPSFPSVSIDTGVHQIDPGSYYHIRLYHNDPNPRSTQGGTWISVEYFETIP